MSIREGAQRLLVLAMKGEWPPVDQVLKALEKSVAAAGEDGNLTPLAGIADPVSALLTSRANSKLNMDQGRKAEVFSNRVDCGER